MPATLNELLKPARLKVDPNSSKAAKQFKHWLKVFTDFLTRCETPAAGLDQAPDINRLQFLFAYVCADVYEYIEECENYDDALAKLKAVYITTPYVIFARHQLAIRKQQPSVTLEEFFQSFHLLSKDCELADVSAEEYRNELVRDAFIKGLSSPSIRQRLLQNNQLTVTQAFDTARSLRTALEHSDAYLNRANIATITHQAEDNPSPASEPNSDDVVVECTSQKKLCYFCVFLYHTRGLPETSAVIPAVRKDISPRYVVLNHPLSDRVNHNVVKQQVNYHHQLYVRLQLPVPQVWLQHLCKFL